MRKRAVELVSLMILTSCKTGAGTGSSMKSVEWMGMQGGENMDGIIGTTVRVSEKLAAGSLRRKDIDTLCEFRPAFRLPLFWPPTYLYLQSIL